MINRILRINRNHHKLYLINSIQKNQNPAAFDILTSRLEAHLLLKLKMTYGLSSNFVASSRRVQRLAITDSHILQRAPNKEFYRISCLIAG